MKDLCVYCQQFQLNNEEGICLSCKEKLSDRDSKELEYYKQKGIAELFYTAIKIDDCFQLKYPENEPTAEAMLFHKRRVECLNDCIGYIDNSIFLPRTKDEVNNFRESVRQYYEGGLTDKQRDLRVAEFIKGNYYGKADSAEFQAKVILATLMSDKERLDWSWWQYMEIHLIDLHKYVDKTLLLNIVQRYFADEIQCFFDLTNYYK